MNPTGCPKPGLAATLPGSTREVELKLLAPPAALERLEGWCRARSSEEARERALVTVYWDTPDLALASAGIALRMRREDTSWIYSLKTLSTSEALKAASVPVRQEWEWPAPPDGTPDWGVLAHHPALKGLISSNALNYIIPIFHSAITRHQWELGGTGETEGAAVVELALDRGEIRLGGPGDSGLSPREPISEVELELKRGPVSALFTLALTLHAIAPLTLGRESKAEVGFRLLTGQTRSPPAPLGPVPGDGEALAPYLRAGLALLAWPEHRALALAALSSVLACQGGPSLDCGDVTLFALTLGLWLEQGHLRDGTEGVNSVAVTY